MVFHGVTVAGCPVPQNPSSKPAMLFSQWKERARDGVREREMKDIERSRERVRGRQGERYTRKASLSDSFF